MPKELYQEVHTEQVVTICTVELIYPISGRGMKNGENFQLLYDLADKMGAAGW